MRTVAHSAPALLRRLAPALLVAACQSVGPAPAPGPVAADPATLAARQALANERSLDARSTPPRSIAVPPLAIRTADTALAPLAYGLADMLMTDLARSGQVIVVERSRIDALLREMQLVRAGLVDSTNAPRVGKLMGARRLVVGALNDRGNGELGIDTRVANTADGTITSAVSARTPLASILDAEKVLAYRLFEEMGVTLTPGERAAIEQRPTGSTAAFLAFSRGVRDEAFGQYASAAANYRAAVAVDPSFGVARARIETVERADRSGGDGNGGRGDTQESKREKAASAGKGGAAAQAGGAINPSPVGTIATNGGAAGAQQQGSESDRGTQAQRQPVLTTVVINVKQLP